MVNIARPAPKLVDFARWLLHYSLRRWPGLLVVITTLFAKSGLQVLQPWPMAILVDHVLKNEPLPDTLQSVLDILPAASGAYGLLGWVVAGTVVIFLLEWVLELASAYARTGFGQRMVYDLAADLLDHLQRLSLGFHRRRAMGDSIRRVTRDSTCISVIVEEALLPVFSALVSLLLMFSLMWQLDPVLTLLALAVAPLLMLALRLYAGSMAEKSYAHEEAEGRMYDVVEQTLSSIPIVHAFSREADADRRFRATTRVALATELALTNVELQFEILVGLSVAVGTATILWIGGRHVLEGQLTVGTVLVFLSYLTSLYGPLESVMQLSSKLQGATGSARRVLEVLSAEQEVQDQVGARPLPHVRGAIRLEHVSFGYEPARAVLNDVCLEVEPGQTVAIVGPTGAGKSTLVSLVPRFFDPWHGRVFIDGHDVREVQLRSLRTQVALVLQDSFLFPLSIADNIAYGRPSATQAEIEAAARTANADGFIQRLPAAYQTLLGEHGATLSGGERQRLAIARALLKDAPILILDEPTSALDAETEAQLLEAMHRLMAGRTTLMIAHRLSTLRNADWIVVLQDGRVAETGTHQQLLAHNAIYARFSNLQDSGVLRR